MEFGLHLRKSDYLNLIGFCDVDWATDPDDKRSTTRYCVYLGSYLISWHSEKQHTVSRSSTEAEYRGLANVVAELSWLESLPEELKITKKKVPIIWGDNLSTVQLAANPVLHARTKHVELDLYFVPEKVCQKKVVVQHVPSVEQTTDVLTKPISSSKFPVLRNKLRGEDLSTLSLRGAIKEKD